MADQTQPPAKQRDRWDKVQLIITLGLAFVAPYLSIQQHRLAEGQAELKKTQDEITIRSQSQGITYTFADKIFAHLDDIGVKQASDKEQIVIDLLDIITEANVDDTVVGAQSTPAERKARLLATPLRMALLTGNDEILIHIGASTDKQAIWLPLAESSGSSVVRGTALRALGKLGRSLDPDKDSTRVLEVLAKVEVLSDGFQNEATLESSLEATGQVARMMAKNPDRYRDEAVVRRAYDDLRSVTRAAVLQTAEQTGGKAGATDGATSAVAKAAQDIVVLFERSGLRAVAPGPTPEAAAANVANVSHLVKELTSNDAGAREQARAGLATTGSAGTDAVLASLREHQGDPRIRLGVASSLYRMPQPVVLDADAARAVVQLIDDDDPAVRKYASEFLMKLYEPATVTVVREKLTQVIAQRPKSGTGSGANGAYNAVVVLGTWCRTLPSEQSATRQSIRQQLEVLRTQIAREPAWVRTAVLIDDLLGASRAQASLPQPARRPGRR